MAKRSEVYTILDVPANGRYGLYRNGLIGLEACLVAGQRYYAIQTYYSIRLPIASAKKFSEWCKQNHLVRPFYRTAMIICTLGQPDTPELLAYDEIDQQEEPKSSPQPRSSRSRRQTSSECSGKERASYSQCSSKPKQSKSRRRSSLGR